MGYFPNGDAGIFYEEEYCSKCIHGPEAVERRGDDNHCVVWLAHLLHNYHECNKPDSILHMLIPRTEPLGNERCKMFLLDPHYGQQPLFQRIPLP